MGQVVLQCKNIINLCEIIRIQVLCDPWHKMSEMLKKKNNTWKIVKQYCWKFKVHSRLHEPRLTRQKVLASLAKGTEAGNKQTKKFHKQNKAGFCLHTSAHIHLGSYFSMDWKLPDNFVTKCWRPAWPLLIISQKPKLLLAIQLIAISCWMMSPLN